MSFEELKALIGDTFGAEVIVAEKTDKLQPYLVLQTERLAEVCLALHDH